MSKKSHHIGKKKIMIRFTAFALVIVLSAVPMMQVYAAKSVSDIQSDKQELQGEINSLDSQLVTLLSEIDVLEGQVNENEAEIKAAEEDLKAAEAAEQKQYESMKLRIQYMYQNDDKNLLTIMLESSSFTDFLNRVEYTNAVYAYDRQLLDSYEATKIEIQGMKASLEDEQTQLKSQQNELSAKKNSLNSMISSKKTQMKDFDKQLAAAKAEAAKQAEAAKKAAAAAQAAQNVANVSGGGKSSGGSSGSGASTNVPGGNPSPATSVSGASVVSYARQFVGNSYVWGGNSLTNGCDCSGFVVQVYAHFGIDLSGSRNSASLRSVGQAVSYENIQPGDIVCYSGHVAIYAGGGTIVEAQSTAAGITNSRSVTCKSIIAIRRVI